MRTEGETFEIRIRRELSSRPERTGFINGWQCWVDRRLVRRTRVQGGPIIK